jgi:uncharacterized coiled-coil DUF342 family protein
VRLLLASIDFSIDFLAVRVRFLTSAPCIDIRWFIGDLLIEVDGRDVTNMDVKQVKEMTKGAPGSPMKLKAKRGSTVYEVLLERSGGTGTSMASISDASSMQGNAGGVVSKELTASERGKEGAEAAMALHEELDRLRASLATTTEELGKAREEMQGQVKASSEASTKAERLEKELAASAAKVAELMKKVSETEGQLDEAKKTVAMMSKTGDERVLALEKAHSETEAMMKEQRKTAEKQALDLEEAQTALRALHGVICKQGPAPVLGGIGVALGTETVALKGKSQKMVKIAQLASSGPAAKSGMVFVGDLLIEIDGKDVTNLDIKHVKELTKGAPGSPMKLKVQRGAHGAQYEVILERSGGTGTSMASISDASSMASSATGAAAGKVLGREPTLAELGKDGCDAAGGLHDEIDRLRRSLATASEELGKSREELSAHKKATAASAGDSKNQQLLQELQQARASVSSLEQRLDSARTQHAADVSALTAKADALAKQLDVVSTQAAAGADAAAASKTKGAASDGGADLLAWSQKDKAEVLHAPIQKSRAAPPEISSKSADSTVSADQERRVQLTVLSARHLPKYVCTCGLVVRECVRVCVSVCMCVSFCVYVCLGRPYLFLTSIMLIYVSIT